MKKKLAMLLVTAMVASMVPATAFARTDNRVTTVKTVTDEADKFYSDVTIIGFELKESQPVGGSGQFMLTISGADFSTSLDDGLTSVSDTVYKDDKGITQQIMDNAPVYTDYNLAAAIPGAYVKVLTASKVMVTLPSNYGTYDADGDTKTDSKIVLPVSIKTTGSKDGVKLAVDSRDTNISAGTMNISTVTSGDTVASADVIDLAPGDTETLKAITIDETVAGGADLEELKFTAPAGFTWVKSPTNFKVTVAGGYQYAGTTGVKSSGWDDNDDGTFKIVFNSKLESTSSRGRGIIVVEGLQLVADTDAKLGDVNVTIKGDASKQTLKVANCVEYAVSIALKEEAPTLVGGRFKVTSGAAYDGFDLEDQEEHETAEFVMKENTADSWFAGRSTTFTLPDGVKFVGVDVTSVKNLDADTIATGYENLIATDDKGTLSTVNGKTAKFKLSEDGTKLTLSGLKTSSASNVKAELGLKFNVSISPDFEGDVKVTVGNSIDDQDVVVAKAVTPIKAAFKTTNVGIAYKDVTVGDITITENAEAALIKDGSLVLAIDETDPDIRFVTDGAVDYEITDGDIDITKVYAKNGKVYMDVKRESTKPSTIKITGLKATLDRTPAEGSYSLLAFGTAVFANNYDEFMSSGSAKAYDGLFDDIEGIKFKDYINVTTAAPDKGTSTTNKVAVTIGSTTYKVNGAEKSLEVAPVIQNNRTLVPTRAISEGLGYQVLWNASTNTATIVTPDNRTAAFTLGSNVVTVNGVPSLTMDTAPAVVDGRMLVPFRALGDALGIAVTWDEATNTATFN